ncbi:MAG: SdrD B-like domain-containing protein [Methylophilaceae bacterium]
MKKLVSVSFILCALLGISSCATLNGDPVERADRKAEKLAPRTPATIFDENSARNALKPGNVEIKSVLISCYGRGILCIQGSVPVENTIVYLYPYTPYLQETLQMEKQLKADNEKNSEYNAVKINLNDKFAKINLKTKTDQYGRYSFKNLKPGKYYVLSDNARLNNSTVKHSHDWEGRQYKTAVNTPADLEFNKIVDVTQNSGVYTFESKMTILQRYVSQ